MPSNEHGLMRSAGAATAALDHTASAFAIHDALERSVIDSLDGNPYPVQFRNQGAFDAWTRALRNTEVWERWNNPQTTCWDIRQDVHWHLKQMPPPSLPIDAIPELRKNRQIIATDISANLKYCLNQGTVIEATPALEALLSNSDVDLSLPMSMMAPPYAAQYLRFGETVRRSLTVPLLPESDRCFDGVFCFYSPPSPRRVHGPSSWALELIFLCSRHGQFNGHLSLLGETDRGSTTVGEWLEKVLSSSTEPSNPDAHRPLHAAVSYVVKVFLYMALKQARTVEHREHDEALRRAAGLGERKRAKLLQRARSLYNGIVVGPADSHLEHAGCGAGSGVAPHWRRGHFRMQPHGPGRQERKLIFMAPILIHADQLQGSIEPKPYRAHAPATAADRETCTS